MENRVLREWRWGRVYLRLIYNPRHLGLGVSCDFEDREDFELCAHSGPFQLWLGK